MPHSRRMQYAERENPTHHRQKIFHFVFCLCCVTMCSMKGFYEQVYDLVAKIPAGTVTTYGDIAKMLGRPRAARFVGYAMNASCETDNLPWHRVTFADGKTWDGQWERVQRELLTAEGVGFTLDGRIDVEKYRWHPTEMPLPADLKDLPLKF